MSESVPPHPPPGTLPTPQLPARSSPLPRRLPTPPTLQNRKSQEARKAIAGKLESVFQFFAALSSALGALPPYLDFPSFVILDTGIVDAGCPLLGELRRLDDPETRRRTTDGGTVGTPVLPSSPYARRTGWRPACRQRLSITTKCLKSHKNSKS